MNRFSRLRKWKLILPSVGDATFLVVALAPVLALLTLLIPVLDDGGLHLESASALECLIAGDIPEILEWRPGAPPTVVADLSLRVLLQVLPTIWALKVVVAAILLGFAFAARQLVVATGVAAPWAILLLPFAWHRPLAMGFLDFSAAAVLALIAISSILATPNSASGGSAHGADRVMLRRIVSVVGLVKADVSSVRAEYVIYGLSAPIWWPSKCRRAVAPDDSQKHRGWGEKVTCEH